MTEMSGCLASQPMVSATSTSHSLPVVTQNRIPIPRSVATSDR